MWNTKDDILRNVFFLYFVFDSLWYADNQTMIQDTKMQHYSEI